MVDKLTTEQFNNLLQQTETMNWNNDSLRLGQSYMNCLHKISPDLYNEVTSKQDQEIDPFYNDLHIPKFLRYIANEETLEFLSLESN